MVDEQTFEFAVRGQVQGVFFRRDTAKHGQALGLRGRVRNMSDGSVSGWFAGSPSACLDMQSWLRSGNARSHVESAEFVEAGAHAGEGFSAEH